MKIQYCSDLHLEFPENRKFLSRNPLHVVGEILVIAGDLVTFFDLEKAREFINFASDHYAAVYWLPGNHEYYGSDIIDKPDPLCEKIKDNFYLVNNQSIIHGGVRLVLSTLWSHISPLVEWDIQRSISDFSTIRYQGEKFTAKRFSLLHEASLIFLKTALHAGGEEPMVVVTHHVPSLMNYPSVYKDSPLTEAFAVELFDLIEEADIVYWVYGHHHVNVPDFNIGETMMVTNQLGYVHHFEHKSFQRGAMIGV